MTTHLGKPETDYLAEYVRLERSTICNRVEDDYKERQNRQYIIKEAAGGKGCVTH